MNARTHTHIAAYFRLCVCALKLPQSCFTFSFFLSYKLSRARAHALTRTFPAGSPLDEDHRRLLQLHGPVADALQLADVPVRDAVAAAHGFGAFAHAHAGASSPPDSGRHLHAVSHHALHPLGAIAVSGAAALLALAGRAHRAAVAAVQHVAGQAVRGDGSALRLVALLRAADGEAFGSQRLGHQARGGEQGHYAQDKPETHDGTVRQKLRPAVNFYTEFCCKSLKVRSGAAWSSGNLHRRNGLRSVALRSPRRFIKAAG